MGSLCSPSGVRFTPDLIARVSGCAVSSQFPLSLVTTRYAQTLVKMSSTVVVKPDDGSFLTRCNPQGRTLCTCCLNATQIGLIHRTRKVTTVKYR